MASLHSRVLGDGSTSWRLHYRDQGRQQVLTFLDPKTHSTGWASSMPRVSNRPLSLLEQTLSPDHPAGRSAARAERKGLAVDAPSGSYPVSVKGVVVRGGRVLLLHNERQEWELPGGRLELGETPPQCVTREITEETGWVVETGPILDSWMYFIDQVEQNVFIVTYGCHLVAGQGEVEPVLSHEHKQVGLFTEAEVADLVMPAGYKASIATWFERLRGDLSAQAGSLEVGG